VPVPEPTATLVLVLLHVPPPVLVSVMDAVKQTVAGPLIADGNGSTVTVVTVAQPVPGNV
jgi:hypothetical protein